jgi:hypothetical protein
MPERSLDPKAAYAVGKFCCNDSVGGVTPRKWTIWQLKLGVQKRLVLKQSVRSIVFI